MRRIDKLTLWRPLLWAVALSCAFSIACSGGSGPGKVRCPKPSPLEADDYAAVIEKDPNRPTVQWFGRVVGYCWPTESDEVREELAEEDRENGA